MNSDQAKAYIYMGGAVVAAYLLYKVATKGAKLASEVGTALNPADSQNIVNRGVNGIGAAISGDTNWTLGGWVYDITHQPKEEKAPEVSALTKEQKISLGKPIQEWKYSAPGTTDEVMSGPTFNDGVNNTWRWY